MARDAQEIIEQYVPQTQIQAQSPDDQKIVSLAQGLYGEFAGVKDPELQRKYMLMGASSIANTFGKGEWKNNDWDTHIYKRLYAVQNQNQPYQESLSGNFPNENAENAFKRAVQISFGIIKGFIPRDATEIYVTPEERKKTFGTKAFPHPEKLELVGKTGKYEQYAYKKTSPKSGRGKKATN